MDSYCLKKVQTSKLLEYYRRCSPNGQLHCVPVAPRSVIASKSGFFDS